MFCARVVGLCALASPRFRDKAVYCLGKPLELGDGGCISMEVLLQEVTKLSRVPP